MLQEESLQETRQWACIHACQNPRTQRPQKNKRESKQGARRPRLKSHTYAGKPPALAFLWHRGRRHRTSPSHCWRKRQQQAGGRPKTRAQHRPRRQRKYRRENAKRPQMLPYDQTNPMVRTEQGTISNKKEAKPRAHHQAMVQLQPYLVTGEGRILGHVEVHQSQFRSKNLQHQQRK